MVTHRGPRHTGLGGNLELGDERNGAGGFKRLGDPKVLLERDFKKTCFGELVDWQRFPVSLQTSKNALQRYTIYK